MAARLRTFSLLGIEAVPVEFEEYAVVGELSLEGRTRPAKGALSMAISAARQRGLRGLVVPDTNASDAAVVEELEVIPMFSLAEGA